MHNKSLNHNQKGSAMKTFTIVAIFVMAASLFSFAQAQESIDKDAISPFKHYCDGYGNPGAKGLGYISVLKVSTGVIEKTDYILLKGTSKNTPKNPITSQFRQTL